MLYTQLDVFRFLISNLTLRKGKIGQQDSFFFYKLNPLLGFSFHVIKDEIRLNITQNHKIMSTEPRQKYFSLT